MTTNLTKKLQAVRFQTASEKMGSANSILRQEMALLGPIIRAEGIDAVVDMIRHLIQAFDKTPWHIDPDTLKIKITDPHSVINLSDEADVVAGPSSSVENTVERPSLPVENAATPRLSPMEGVVEPQSSPAEEIIRSARKDFNRLSISPVLPHIESDSDDQVEYKLIELVSRASSSPKTPARKKVKRSHSKKTDKKTDKKQ